jgi:hypothetical protein
MRFMQVGPPPFPVPTMVRQEVRDGKQGRRKQPLPVAPSPTRPTTRGQLRSPFHQIRRESHLGAHGGGADIL